MGTFFMIVGVIAIAAILLVGFASLSQWSKTFHEDWIKTNNILENINKKMK